MVGSMRRLDRHRREILLDDALDAASQTFQLALQLAYLEMGGEIDAVLGDGSFATESGERLTRRALASYAAAALLMPYSAFARAVEARRYDVEALAPPVRRQLRADRAPADHAAEAGPGAGAVLLHPRRSGGQRLQAAGRRGLPLRRATAAAVRCGPCITAFRTPREIVTQWLELPDGQRFFSIARTVTAGGGGFGTPRVERAIALGCAAEHAGRLIYTAGPARRRRGGDPDRRHLPPVPAHRMHRPVGAADRPPDPARRYPSHQPAVRLLRHMT